MLSFWHNHMHQSTVAKKIMQRIKLHFQVCMPFLHQASRLNTTLICYTVFKRTPYHLVKPQEYRLLERRHISFIYTDAAVVEAWKFINKVEIETDFSCIPAVLSKLEGKGRLFDIRGRMPFKSVSAYSRKYCLSKRCIKRLISNNGIHDLGTWKLLRTIANNPLLSLQVFHNLTVHDLARPMY